VTSGPTRREPLLGPSGIHARVQANLDALTVLDALVDQDRPATNAERMTLAQWSGWGPAAVVFDEAREEWATVREQLRERLGEREYAAARLTTLNAHYTHPHVAAAMWKLAAQLGYDGGRVLEPGCGPGVFIALAPDQTALTGVELDPTTAAIAEALHPDATVINRSFAEFGQRNRHAFELVIGNVPFGDIRLHDTIHNRGNHSLHNHFLIKSLALTRPGGLVIALTSRYTMDATNPAARRELAELGELLGAVRLPSGAHRRSAGTEAVTDLLVLRRRHPDPDAGEEPKWLRTRQLGLEGGETRVNEYFLAHPARVLGELTVGHGMYGADTLLVRGEHDPEEIAARIAEIGEQIVREAPPMPAVDVDVDASVDQAGERAAVAPEGLWNGHLLALPDGAFAEVNDGVQEVLAVPRSIGPEVRHLLGLRDQARRVLTLEAESLEDTPLLDSARTALRESYDSYYARYGAINRFSLRRSGRVNEQTGEERMARVTPTAQRILGRDPFAALVRSLEIFDETAQQAAPSGLLRQRMVMPREPVRGVETPSEAVAVCLETHGRVDLSEIARLRGLTEPDARAELAELVYEDLNGQLAPGAEYLSGNVREKLAAARAAAVKRPELAVNVQALERVLPQDLGAEEIEPRMGAVWIPVADHQAFLRELLEDETLDVESAGGGVWGVRGVRRSVLAINRWGTARTPAPQLARYLMEQRPIKVMDELEDGSRVLNPEETAAAQEKAQAMQERFSEWVWEDPERARRLLSDYNARFNSIVLRDYDGEGKRLTFPGLARTFTPREHQRAAVARMLAEPTVGLFHDVGAGKTAEMIIGATELRRLGLVRKPVVVVPNHMLEQFSREWLQLYPQARVLAASSQDIAGEKRRLFVARAAMNDWDGVIMTRSAFERIPVSADAEIAYREEQLAELRAMLERAKGGSGLTVKRLEKAVARDAEKLKRLRDVEKDRSVSFEETGFDYVIIDEAHAFKNLETESNIQDAAIEGSKRATDLHLKMELLRHREGSRVATFATATPIANSVTEAHVMLRYLRPDLLRAAGVEGFDQWAATFGETVTEVEMAPAGAGTYRLKTRFARFQNVPEMLRMWHVFADVKTAEDLQLPTPLLAERPDGARGPETIVVEPSPQLEEYVRGLADRAEDVRAGRVAPEEDNMLLISSDGRKAALDLRLATGERGDSVTKLEIAAERIARIYDQHRDSSYLDPDTGEQSAISGTLQIVFCDLGTPKREQWNAYDELREQLHARGLPSGSVRYVHEARNDREKQQLFHAARAGHIAVLIGSTEKMGIGTNIQARAIALHHLDCPWRPADIEQRDGRIRRQGNQNAEVHILRYVVERSFDGYSWQTVERKARFIAQVTRGRLDVRAIEDLGDSTLSFAEVKALASGDPLILDLARAQNDLTRLQRLHRSWNRGKTSLTDTIKTCTRLAEARNRQIAAVGDAIGRRTDTHGDKFRMTVDGKEIASRTDAGELLVRWAQSAPANQPRPVGQLGAIDIIATLVVDRYNGSRAVRFELHDLPAEKAQRTLHELVDQPVGMVRQLEHRVATLHELKGRLEGERDGAVEEAGRARETLGRPFKHDAALRDAAEEVKRIKEQMRASDERPASRDMSPTVAPSTSDMAERTSAALGQDRTGRLLRARIALKERFGHSAGADEGPLSWHDLKAHDCCRQITAILNATRCDPADRDTLRDHDDQALKQLADETLITARAMYRTSPQTPGSAHHAAQRDQPHQLRDASHSSERGFDASR
jgi:N12 class adenine-specific DNA methylase